MISLSNHLCCQNNTRLLVEMAPHVEVSFVLFWILSDQHWGQSGSSIYNPSRSSLKLGQFTIKRKLHWVGRLGEGTCHCLLDKILWLGQRNLWHLPLDQAEVIWSCWLCSSALCGTLYLVGSLLALLVALLMASGFSCVLMPGVVMLRLLGSWGTSVGGLLESWPLALGFWTLCDIEYWTGWVIGLIQKGLS